MIVDEKLTLGACALVAAGRIDARVRTVAVIRQTLVLVKALMLVAAVVISASAQAHIRPNRVAALVIAVSVIRFALIDVVALGGTFISRTESSEAGTLETSVQIVTVLRTPSVAAFAFIDVSARFACVAGLVTREAVAAIFFGVANLRASAVIRGADIHLDTCPSVGRKRRSFDTIANHLIVHRITNVRTTTILLLAQIDGQLNASLRIGGQIHAVGTLAMVAIGLVDTFVRTFRFRFVAQMLAQIAFACALIRLQVEIVRASANE